MCGSYSGHSSFPGFHSTSPASTSFAFLLSIMNKQAWSSSFLQCPQLHLLHDSSSLSQLCYGIFSRTYLFFATKHAENLTFSHTFHTFLYPPCLLSTLPAPSHSTFKQQSCTLYSITLASSKFFPSSSLPLPFPWNSLINY